MCYSKPGCVGDIVTAPGLTARDCCAGTNDGQSYKDGVCTVLQCIGKHNKYFVVHVIIIIIVTLLQPLILGL